MAAANNSRPANTFFFGVREENLVIGVTADIVADRVNGAPRPSLIVGGRSREGRPAKWASIVPASLSDRPQFNQASKIVSADVALEDIPGGKQRSVLVSHKEGTDWLVLVRTGFRVGREGIMGDMMDLLNTGVTLKEHGSFSFDRGTAAFNVAKGRSEIADFAKVAAVREGSTVGRRIPILRFPESSYDLWRVPVGAIVIVRDVTGKLFRLIGGKTSLQVVDADGYDSFFDMLLDAIKQAPPPKVVLDEDDASRKK